MHLIIIYNIIFVDSKERSKEKMRFTHQRFTPILRGLYVNYPNKETKYINESGTNHGLHYVISQILNCKNSSYKIHYINKKPYAVFSQNDNRDCLAKPCFIMNYEYQRHIFNNMTEREARELADYILDRGDWLEKQFIARAK